jgi:hypothetical protein
MDKISGIIPSSARVSSVDLKEAAPVRPGTPGFGRPEGASSLKSSISPQDTARRGVSAQIEQMDWRSKDAANSSIVQSISDGFFSKNRKEVEAATQLGGEQPLDAAQVKSAAIVQMGKASKPAGFRTDDVRPVRIESFDSNPEELTDFERSAAPAMLPLAQPDGFYPRGSFINRVA